MRAWGSPWPCVAAAGTRAVARGRGSSRRPGPQGAAGSHSTQCRGSPCTCSGHPGTSPSPGRGGGADGSLAPTVEGRAVRGNTPGLEVRKCGAGLRLAFNQLCDPGQGPSPLWSSFSSSVTCRGWTRLFLAMELISLQRMPIPIPTFKCIQMKLLCLPEPLVISKAT